MQKVTNFRRFYALIKRMPGADKQLLVYQHTHGRTDSLRELTSAEYRALCDDMERATGYDEVRRALREERRTRRSVVLHLMQKLGINTSDWDCVDAFCLDPRIAGKKFRPLSIDELIALAVKLRTIQDKGGLKQKSQPCGGAAIRYTFIFNNAIKN